MRRRNLPEVRRCNGGELVLRVAGYVVLLAVLAVLGVLCAAFPGIPAG